MAKTYSKTAVLSMSICSVVFCWFYGLPTLFVGVFSYRKTRKAGKKKGADLARRLAVAGIIMSGLFTLYYIAAFIKGAYISLF